MDNSAKPLVHAIPEFRPKVSKLAREIAFLRDKGQPTALLAHEFGVDKGHIAVLVFRGKNAGVKPLPPVRLADSPWFQLPPNPPLVAPNMELINLEERVEQIFDQKSQAYLFFDGIRILKSLLPKIGSIADPARRRLLARIYHHIAWFYVHSGYDTSAYRYASWSMQLSQQSSEMNLRVLKPLLITSSKEVNELLTRNTDLLRYSDTARIKSLAVRKLGYPREAWEVLNSAHQALTTAKSQNEHGSEYFRQRGALLLKHDINQARAYFTKAMVAMKRKKEYRSEAHLRMVGTRNLNLVDQNCDEALELTIDIEKTFGVGSLEHVLNAHYAAACCFCTDSPAMIQDGLEVLCKAHPFAKHFGNQVTISRLLEMTPDFKLSYTDRMEWVMRVLETNAFSSK